MAGRLFTLMFSGFPLVQVSFALYLVSIISCDVMWGHVMYYRSGVTIFSTGIWYNCDGNVGALQCAQVTYSSLQNFVVSCSHPRHHAMNSAAIFLYALTSCVAGYVSGSFFKKLGGTAWTWNIILTASLFALPFFFVWSTVNTVAWINLSTQALPFTTIILIFILWLVGKYHSIVYCWLLW